MKKGQPSGIYPADRARAIYNHILQNYPKKITSTQGYLRLEKELVDSRSNIQFNVLTNDGTPRASEKRLALTDLFFATEMSLYLMKITDAQVTAGVEFGSIMDTYPNSITYDGANEAAALRTMYNGNFNVKIDNDVIIEGLDNMRFYRAGQAQQGVEVSVDTNTNPAYVADEWNSASYGMYPLTPNILFSGTAKNSVFIELPDSVDMSDPDATSKNYVICVFRGILIQNASGFYKDMQSKPGRF